MSIKKIHLFGILMFGLSIFIGMTNQRQHIADIFSVIFILFSLILLVMNLRTPIEQTPLSISYLALIFFVVLSGLHLTISSNSAFVISWIAGLYPFVAVIVFVHFYKRDMVTEQHLVGAALFLAIVGYVMVLINSASFADITTRQARTNWANLIGASIPTFFLIKKKMIRYALIAASAIFMVIALKRSGLLVAGLALLVSFFFDVDTNKRLQTRVFTRMLSLVIALTTVVLIFTADFFSESINRMRAIPRDQGSGRLDFFIEGAKAFLGSDPYQKIFGQGPSAFRFISQKHYSTHADIMDFLLSYGVFTSFILGFIYFRLFYIFFRLRKTRYAAFVLVGTSAFGVYSLLSAAHYYFYFFPVLFISIAYMEVLLINHVQNRSRAIKSALNELSK